LVSYTQSITFALEFFKDVPLTTTIIPVWRNHFLPQNIFTKPADTLPSLLLALDFLTRPNLYFQTISKTITDQDQIPQNPKDYQTAQDLARTEAEHILSHYAPILATKTLELAGSINELTGLVDENSSLSGLVRRSSFYENVCVWKSVCLAIEMGIIDLEDLQEHQKPNILKQNIKDKFFRNKIIYHDCTEESNLMDNVCADFLVGHSLGFWDLKDEQELNYIRNFVDLILADDQKNIFNSPLMSPLGMYYSKKNPSGALLYLKMFAPDYMGRTIWSHWSVELCVLLKDLSDITKDQHYLKVAKTIIQNTKIKILEHKGYPELYDNNLKAYQTFFYKSIIDTGWIVNYEWVKQYVGE
jgi:hypothetical protein